MMLNKRTLYKISVFKDLLSIESSFKLYSQLFSLNLMGNVNETLTAIFLCFPGSHFGDD